jgi:hypothetical protein
MQIQYRNTEDDIKTWFFFSQRNAKKQHQDAYLYWMLWEGSVCGFGIFVSLRSEQIFAVIIFLILLGLFLKKYWSFSARWKEQALAYTRIADEYAASLSIDKDGLTESYLGLNLFVPWNQIHNYAVFENRLFVRFLRSRGLIIPLRDLKEDEKVALIEMLTSQHIPKEEY